MNHWQKEKQVKQPEINVVKFFCSVALLIFGRKRLSTGDTDYYRPIEACSAIDDIARYHKPKDRDEEEYL